MINMENLPVVSVPKLPNAPTGTIEGSIVPVVFGEVKIAGKVIFIGNFAKTSDLTKLRRYGNQTEAYIADVWELICMGTIDLLDVYINEKKLVSGIDYSLDRFNYGNGDFKPALPPVQALVNVRTGGIIYITLDGLNWTRETSGIVTDLYCIAYGINMYVTSGAGDTILISRSLGLWEKIDATFTFYSLCFGAGKFVGVGANGLVCTSIDGINWVQQFFPSNNSMYSVIYNGDVFIAVGFQRIFRSMDAVTWVEEHVEADITFRSVCYSNGIFIAVGYTDPFPPQGIIYRSILGEGVWTREVTDPVYVYWSVSTNGKYFLVSGNHGILTYSVSGDTGTWGSVNVGVDDELRSINYFNNRYFFVLGNSYVYRMVAGNSKPGTILKKLIPIGTGLSITCADRSANYDYVTKLSGIAHLFFNPPDSDDGINPKLDKRVVLDSSNKVPEIEFIVRQYKSYAYIDGYIYKGGDIENKYLGLNPAVVLLDILQNKQWGLGIPDVFFEPAISSFVNVGGIFTNEHAVGSGRQYGINFILDDITTAREVFDRIRETTDIFCAVEDGLIVCKSLFHDPDDEPAAVITLTDDDLLSCSIKTQSWDDIFNVFEGEYLEPDLNYAKRSIYVKNESAINMVGGIEKKKKIDLTYFIDQDVASMRLNEIMQRESIPRLTISCSASHILALVNPGDSVIVNSVEYNIDSTFTVIQKSVGESNDLTINIDLQPRFSDLFDKNFISVMASQGNLPVYTGNKVRERLTFAKFSNTVTRGTPFTTAYETSSRVAFLKMDGLLLTPLIYGTDYTIDASTRRIITLTSRWNPFIHFNSGKSGNNPATATYLTVETWED